MYWFYNLTIKTKLSISNSILGLLILLLAGVSIQRLLLIDENVQQANKGLMAVETLLHANRDFYAAWVAERSMLFARPGSKDFKSMQDSHQQSLASADHYLTRFEQSLVNSELTQLFKAFTLHRLEWETITGKIREYRLSDTRAGLSTARELSFGSGADAFKKMSTQIDSIIEYMEQQADAATQSSIKS